MATPNPWGMTNVLDVGKSPIKKTGNLSMPTQFIDQGFTFPGQNAKTLPARNSILDRGKSPIKDLGTHTFPGQHSTQQSSSSGSPQQQSSGGGAPQMGGGSFGGMSAGGGGGGMPAGGWDMGQFVSQLAGVLGGQQEKPPEKPKTQAQLHPNGTPSGANYKDPRMQSPSWIGGANLFDDKTHGQNFTSQLAARPTPAAPAPTTPAPTTPTPTNPKPTTPAKPSRPGGHGHGHGHHRPRPRGRWW